MTTFDQDMDGTMEPSEDGRWVRSDVFYTKLQSYGQQCAAHAREMALSEAAKVAASTVCDTHIPTEVRLSMFAAMKETQKKEQP